MKNRTVLRARAVTGIAVAALAGSLALAGCSSDDASSSSPSGTPTSATTTPAPEPAQTTSPADVAALAKVTVKGDLGSKPTVSFDTPFTVSGPVARVDKPGTGAAIEQGELLKVRIAAFQGADGKAVNDNYAGDPEPIVNDPNSLVGTLVDAFKGQKVGVRVVFAAPGQDASGATAVSVYTLEVVGTAPTRATGTPVTPAAGLPTVTLDGTGAPSIKIPDGYKEPSDLVVQPLIKGAGKKVTATSTVMAQYTGWTTDGKEFDSSWSRGTPASFSLAGGVIEGWTKGLAGQTVGSQVLLVIPAAQAYGDNPPEGSNIAKGATLIFVVDILDAQDAQQ